MADPSAESPVRLLGRLAARLTGLGIRDFALTGGAALGAWVQPRVTRDIDLCGVLPKEAVDPLLAQMDGVRAGPSEVPDVVRFRFGDWDVDLFVAKTEYDRACLDRAVEVEIEGTKFRVVSPEDLLIHKLIKLRTDKRRILQDLADLRALLEERGDGLDREYLRRWLPPPELEILEAVRAADDETLLRRLLGR